jgi:hypothetical protein
MKIRTPKANMIILSCLAIGLIVLALLVGFGFYLILSDQKRGQAQCDEIALNLAISLNADDRIGQMNTIVEHSRELVYLSRQASLAAPDLNVPACTMLADQLLAEATDSSLLVDNERRNQIDLATAGCRKNVTMLCKGRTKSGYWVLPWFFEDKLNVKQLEFGSIAGNLSNITGPPGIKDLRKFDLDHHYMDAASGLYCSNINAKLPEPDAKLPFYLSALPARVENTDSPSRLANQEAFVPMTLIFDGHSPNFNKPEQLPEAVHVVGNMLIVTNNHRGTLDIPASSVATAPGALDNP